MDNRTLQVPVSFLMSPDQPATGKLVQLALLLRPDARPLELERLTGLCRHTILKAMDRAAALPRRRKPAGEPKVRIPGALLADPKVGARAKLVYGLLQAIPGAGWQSGRFTYPALSAATRLGPNTLKRAIAELLAAGWVRTKQESRLRPIQYTLGTPEWRRGQAEAALAKRRLNRAQFGGEAIMQELLSLLIDSDQFTDNARPGFLINPVTGERLELDRLYWAANVAFEFHGAQHDRKTGRFTQEQVDAQRRRDLIKAGLCVYQGIHLVVIRAEDLSVPAMTRKVGRSMPLRDLAGHEPLIEGLEEAALLYWAKVGAATAG